MTTWLHDTGALRALAEAGGVAGDWANVRLAIRAPELATRLAEDPWDAAIGLATGAAGAVEGVLERLRSGRRDPGAAELVEAVVSFGLLPEDREPWARAARGAIRGDGRDADVLLASFLADLGEVDRETLAAATRVASDRHRHLVPRLVLRFVEPASQREVAAEIATALAREEARRPGIVGLALARLGVPVLAVEEADPEEAARLGASVAGAPPPSLRAAHGSARRRARRWVADLLVESCGPAAALLRALAREEEGPDPYELLAAAAWLASDRPADPLDGVLSRGAGEDAAVLAAARRAVGAAEDGRLVEAVRRPGLRQLPAVALAAPRVAVGVPELADAVTDRTLRWGAADGRTGVVGCVALARSPERLLELLGDPETHALGLAHARYASCEEVLGALLEAPVPADPRARELLAWALCDQADRAALDRLRGLVAADPELGGVEARALALLGEG